jgi:hypothetical protein
MGPDGSDPRAVDLCPTGGDRFPSSVRLSLIVTTGGVRGRSLVLDEMGSMTDPKVLFPKQSKGLRSFAAYPE